MAEPARADVGHLFHALRAARRLADLIDDRWLDAIEHAGKYRLARLPDDLSNGDGDEQAHDRIRQRVAEPHPGGADEHREAGEAVDARVVAVGDQCGALDFAADLDADDRGYLIAGEADDRRSGNRREVADLLRMQKSLDRLVTRDHGTEGDDQHDDHARQVLDAPIAVRKALARLAARERERDP